MMPASAKKNKLSSQWPVAFWIAVVVVALALPVLSMATSLPSTRLIDQTIIAQCPIAQQKDCMAAADLLQALASFYEIVIFFLLALIALIASLVYLSIKSASKRQIEEQFENDFKSEWFQDRLQRHVDAASLKLAADSARRIENLEKAVIALNKQDQTEDQGEGTLIIVPGERNGAR